MSLEIYFSSLLKYCPLETLPPIDCHTWGYSTNKLLYGMDLSIVFIHVLILTFPYMLTK